MNETFDLQSTVKNLAFGVPLKASHLADAEKVAEADAKRARDTFTQRIEQAIVELSSKADDAKPL